MSTASPLLPPPHPPSIRAYLPVRLSIYLFLRLETLVDGRGKEGEEGSGVERRRMAVHGSLQGRSGMLANNMLRE